MSTGGPGVDERFTLGLAFAALGVLGCCLLDVWGATGLATLLGAGEWRSPSLNPGVLLPQLARGGVAGLLSPGGSPVVFWLVLAISSAVELVGGWWLARWVADRLAGWRDPSRLARKSDLGDLAGKQARRKARGLRPSLEGNKQVASRDLGIRLMQVAGRDVYMSWEDVALVIMGPRSNKTSAIVVPTILSATGPVVATSNKPDVWSLTKDLRAAVGPIYTIDPMQVAYAEQTTYVDPIEWVRSEPEDRRLDHASRFISHFVATISGERSDPFFSNAAERVATGAVLAAAATSNGTLRDVLEYLADGRREAVQALDASGAHQDAAELENTISGADVTTEGIYETARTALKALRSEALLRWVTPPHTWVHPPRHRGRVDKIDPWQLFTSPRPPTLYLLSKEGGGSASPLITALVDRISDCAERTAAASGGRLDPSLSLVLDESANICPLKSLPAQFSHWGSRGIQALAILQSYKQGAGVWGREGMDALWSAATVKLVGAGIEDVDFLSWLSQLAGEHYVPQPASLSRDRRGGGSEQHSLVKEPIFPISRLRALDKRESLLLTPGRPVAHGGLMPWYRETDDEIASASDITAANATAGAEIEASAIEALGPHNPVAQMLRRRQHSTDTGQPQTQTQHANPL